MSKTSNFLSPNRQTPLWLFIGFLLAYLPFLSQGYGKEFDAWSNALNARVISTTGVYEVSRLPGHPLYELLLSGLYPLNHSYFFYNLLSALVSAGTVVLVFKIARFYQLKNALWLALTFGLTPVFFIAGTYTIDYNFALFFVLLSWWQGLQKKPLLAGLSLAAATGWRISSIGFGLPFLLFFAPYFKTKHYVFFALSAGLGSLLTFAPPLATYGFGFLDFHKPPYPTLPNLLYKLSFGVWGLVLLLALALAIIISLARWPKTSQQNLPPYFGWALAVVIAMQLAVFLRLPFKSEFFIPALPFILLAVFIGLKPMEARLLSLAALLSLLTFGFDYHQSWRGAKASAAAITFNAGGQSIFIDPLQGPLLLDQGKRQQKAATVGLALQKLVTLEQKNQKCWVVAGWYWPHLVFKYKGNLHHFEHYATKADLAQAKKNGYTIYYLPEMDTQNEIMEGVYLNQNLAQALL